MPLKKRFLIIAHRGASGTHPENTFAAFRQAIHLGVDFIETDIRLTKDGYPVVFHDKTLRRTTKGKGSLHEKTLDELSMLEVGSWFHPFFSNEKIPTLTALLQSISHKTGLLLELKPDRGNEKVLAEAVLQTLQKAPQHRKTIILGSSDPSILKALLKKKESSSSLALIFKKRARKSLLWALKMGLPALCPAKKVCTRTFLREAHSHGLKVYVWVANKKREIRRFAQMGVDGIMTDYPERCSALFSPLQS
ncbi:MAG: hypothetical protein HY590_05805 [Candidatus Omnitrophica bacterium]|nr:hypothetical protein [Candidatus Omnitrophota bacterium]